MTPYTILEHDGIAQAISEHALDYGIPASRIIMRLDAGWSVEQAITQPINCSAIPRPEDAEDQADDPYRNVYTSTFLEAAGANKSKFKHKRKHKPHKPKSNATRHTFNGESLTVREWSERTGISLAVLGGRLSGGWSIERALTQPVRRSPRRGGVVANRGDMAAGPARVSRAK